jgi:uncharacterized membrane protein
MKTYKVISAICFLIILLFVGSFAIGDTGHGREISDILAEIREEQGIGSNDTIDPDRVSDKHLEEVGEAVMELMHPNEREHDFMDQVMGGEGSESLEYMHRMMGYRYLRGEYGSPISPMMGRGMMGMRMMGGLPMMGWGMHGRPGRGIYSASPGMMMGGAWPFFFWRIVMWIILFAVIGVVVWLIIRNQKQRGLSNIASSYSGSALEIAKRRYASGEISREEFETLKRDIQ